MRSDALTGRFVTGLGVGSLSMAVPLYNAEIAPPEVRGSLVALQQLAITFGIMVSFWIDYGMNLPTRAQIVIDIFTFPSRYKLHRWHRPGTA